MACFIQKLKILPQEANVYSGFFGGEILNPWLNNFTKSYLFRGLIIHTVFLGIRKHVDMKQNTLQKMLRWPKRTIIVYNTQINVVRFI